VFVGVVGVGEEAFGEPFVLVLQTAQDDEAGDDPEDAGVAVVDHLPEGGVLFLGSFDDTAEGHDLALLLGLEEVPLALLPVALVLLQGQD
jgi:hypothetical protein